jgi:hypothetical protein
VYGLSRVPLTVLYLAARFVPLCFLTKSSLTALWYDGTLAIPILWKSPLLNVSHPSTRPQKQTLKIILIILPYRHTQHRPISVSTVSIVETSSHKCRHIKIHATLSTTTNSI